MVEKVPVAVVLSDVHLSARPPRLRAEEPDWFAAMERSLRQPLDYAEVYDLPVFIAGDIFDHWTEPAVLINWAIGLFAGYMFTDRDPRVFVIPGQHDLPNHRLDQEHRSIYGTLIRAGVVQHLETCRFFSKSGMFVHPFAWNQDIQSPDPKADGLQVAVVHKYIWHQKSTAYPGVEAKSNISQLADSLSGYDVAVFGDNHKQFDMKLKTYKGTVNVFNNGTLMRRKQDELESVPRFGVIMSDASVESIPINVEGETYTVLTNEDRPDAADFSEYIEELQDMASDSIDFRDAVVLHMKHHDVPSGVKDHVLRAIEAG